MSGLLLIMRHVRESVRPDARYIHPIHPVTRKLTPTISDSAEEGGGVEYRDPFSAEALQRRLHRYFFEKDPVTGKLKEIVTVEKLKATIKAYLSGDFAEQRASGITLHSLFRR